MFSSESVNMAKFSTLPWRPDRQKYTKWELETFDMIIDAEIDELEHGVYRSAEDLEEASTAASTARAARRMSQVETSRTKRAVYVIVGIFIFFFVMRKLIPDPHAHWRYYVVGEHTGSNGETVPEIVAVKEDQPPPVSKTEELHAEQISEPEYKEEVVKAQVAAEVEEKFTNFSGELRDARENRGIQPIFGRILRKIVFKMQN